MGKDISLTHRSSLCLRLEFPDILQKPPWNGAQSLILQIRRKIVENQGAGFTCPVRVVPGGLKGAFPAALPSVCWHRLCHPQILPGDKTHESQSSSFQGIFRQKKSPHAKKCQKRADLAKDLTSAPAPEEVMESLKWIYQLWWV